MTRHRPRILVNRHSPGAVQVFSRLGEVTALETAAITRDAVREADILVVRSETRVDAQLLEGSRVRFVGTLTIGTDHVDKGYLRERGIVFAAAPGSNAASVCEYVTAGLLIRARRTGRPLGGTAIGIVGVGNVGRRVAQAARVLGMRVLLNDPPLARATGDPVYRPLEELLEADVITLHVPLTRTGPDATHHFFGRDRLGKMKPGSLLVNTSRGGVIPTPDLLEALASGRPGAAILDVWEGEPDIDARLLEKSFLGTPHIAGYSLDGKLNALRMVYGEVCRFLGVPASWIPPEEEQGGELPAIRIPPGMREEEAILAHVVGSAYSIELDDGMLKGTLELEREGRRASFVKLRSGYRVRREFPARVVDLEGGGETAGGILAGLGFRISGRGG
ncbi:MAG: 4-phosphoerythronate dehydrogenase [Bacteroidota bacterium]